MNSEQSYADCIRPALGLCDALQVLEIIAVSPVRQPPEHALMEARKAVSVGLYSLHTHS